MGVRETVLQALLGGLREQAGLSGAPGEPGKRVWDNPPCSLRPGQNSLRFAPSLHGENSLGAKSAALFVAWGGGERGEHQRRRVPCPLGPLLGESPTSREGPVVLAREGALTGG